MIAAELTNLRRAFYPAILSFAAIFIFLMAFRIAAVPVGGFHLYLPIPAFDSVSLSIFNRIQSDLLPSNIKVLVTDPIHALLVQIDISLFFAFVVTLPILLYRVFTYLRPALRDGERQLVKTFIIPTAGLFVIGCLIGYFFLVPAVLRLLNDYAQFLSASTYFEINRFISFVLSLTFVSGLAFTLPSVMKILSRIGLGRAFWRRHLKFAVVGSLAIAFLVAPDLMTMIFVAGVLLSLYALGYYVS